MRTKRGFAGGAWVCLGLCAWGLGLVAPWVFAAAGARAADGPLPPAEAQRTFEVDPGLRVELVAAEPLVVSPSAFAWDESGRLFVAENPGYPVGPAPGKPPVGVVTELVDADGDGQADRRVVFAEGLGFPNGLLPWRGGLLVTDAPNLWWLADTNGDGRADVREMWFTGFATNQTTQLRACYPTFGPDGWIYVSRGWSGGVVTSPKWTNLPPVDLKNGDFRFRPDGTAAEAIGGNGQFGLVLDDLGRRFIVSNRNPLMHAVVTPRWWRRHPALPFTDLVQDVSPSGYAAKVHPRSPDTTTSGYMPELMAAPHAGSFTAACGIHQYYGEALGAEYLGNWFICEPAQSLIQRQVAEANGPTFASRPASAGRDFLTSSDGWFRPVYTATGPDGALYLADMYRRIIDHPDYLPADIRGKLDFESGKDLGRLWRVRRVGDRAKPEVLTGATVDRLVDALGATNGWVRQTAQRLLWDRRDTNVLVRLLDALGSSLPPKDAPVPLNTLARAAVDPVMGPHLGHVRRLWALAGFHAQRSDSGSVPVDLNNRTTMLLMYGAFDRSPAVRATVWRIMHGIGSEPKRGLPDVAYDVVAWWADDPNPEVRFEFALQCGEQDDWPPVVPALVRVARRDAGDRWMRAAVLSGLKDREARFLQELFDEPLPDTSGAAELMADCGRLVGALSRPSPDALSQVLEHALAPPADGTGWQPAALRGLSEGLRQHGAGSLRAVLRDLARTQTNAVGFLARLDEVGVRIARVARDTAADRAVRRSALQFLGELDFAQAREPLVATLAEGEPVELQVVAARVLGGFDAVEAGRILTARERWARMPQPVRDVALAALTSRAALLPALFDAIERGDLPVWSVDPQRRRQLQGHGDPVLRERARGLFAAAGGGDRLKVYESLKPILGEPASGGRGHAVFTRTCANCHQLGGEGVTVGPDLTGVKNQPAEALLLHIVVPDAEIYPGYQACEVETRDGRSLTGLLVAETAETLVLRRAGGEQETVARSAVASFALSRLSLMPQELEKTMTRQELADLIAYLRGRP